MGVVGPTTVTTSGQARGGALVVGIVDVDDVVVVIVVVVVAVVVAVEVASSSNTLVTGYGSVLTEASLPLERPPVPLMGLCTPRLGTIPELLKLLQWNVQS